MKTTSRHRLTQAHLDDIRRTAGRLVAWGVVLAIAYGWGVGLAVLIVGE